LVAIRRFEALFIFIFIQFIAVYRKMQQESSKFFLLWNLRQGINLEAFSKLPVGVTPKGLGGFWRSPKLRA
jgi:hypothetical protein